MKRKNRRTAINETVLSNARSRRMARTTSGKLRPERQKTVRPAAGESLCARSQGPGDCLAGAAAA
jgi:hypothetical protein